MRFLYLKFRTRISFLQFKSANAKLASLKAQIPIQAQLARKHFSIYSNHVRNLLNAQKGKQP